MYNEIAPYAAPETKGGGGDARKGNKKEASPIRKHPFIILWPTYFPKYRFGRHLKALSCRAYAGSVFAAAAIAYSAAIMHCKKM